MIVLGKKDQRQAELLDIIRKQGMIPIKKMASQMRVSEMTIYRDLNDLKYHTKESDFHDNHEDPPPPYNLLQAIQKANEQKERIGKFAAGLLSENDVIILDTGSTTNCMLNHFPENKNISVVCFNANVLLELRHKPGIQIFFAGGVFHPNTEMCESPEGISFLRRLRANKVFLSAAGIHENLGVTCANEYEIATKKVILESASEHILLADSTKFGQVRSSYFCDLDAIHSIVTDSNLSGQWQETLSVLNIPFYMV